MEINIKVRIIMGMPTGIDRVEWAGPRSVMYHRTEGNQESIGLFDLDAHYKAELPHSSNRGFAVHQATQRAALVGDNVVMITQGFPVTKVVRMFMMTTVHPMDLDTLVWSGDGELLSFVTRRYDQRSTTGMYWGLHVLRMSDGQNWFVESTAGITNISLSSDGKISFQELGASTIKIMEPFGALRDIRLENRYVFGPQPGQIALLKWDGRRRATLSATKNEHSAPEEQSSYLTELGEEMPSRIVWSGDGTRLLENPVVSGQAKWLAHDLNLYHTLEIREGDMAPLRHSPITFSPDGSQAVCLTFRGPAIISFEKQL